MKIKEGDRIEILDVAATGARVKRGDVLKVTHRRNDTVFVTESPRAPWAQGWWFSDSSEGEVWKRVDPES